MNSARTEPVQRSKGSIATICGLVVALGSAFLLPLLPGQAHQNIANVSQGVDWRDWRRGALYPRTLAPVRMEPPARRRCHYRQLLGGALPVAAQFLGLRNHACNDRCDRLGRCARSVAWPLEPQF